MTIFQAIVYGVVQGLAEFLPISSSAHLVAIPQIFGWQDGGLTFDIALHLGTLLAVVTYFFKDWLDLIGNGFSKPGSKEGKLFWYIVAACIPGGIAGVLLEKKAETTFRNLALIGTMMIIMGIVLYIADKSANNNKVSTENIGFKRSLIIGISQALAIIPGVSRSGITMSSGLLSGLKKEDSARFSFLLSTPIIFGAGILKLKDIIHTPISNAAPFAIGIITSAIVGFAAIKFMLGYVKKRGFGIFVIYRFIVGFLFIAIYFAR